MLYLGNLLVLASVNFLITGSIGFIATCEHNFAIVFTVLCMKLIEGVTQTCS